MERSAHGAEESVKPVLGLLLQHSPDSARGGDLGDGRDPGPAVRAEPNHRGRRDGLQLRLCRDEFDDPAALQAADLSDAVKDRGGDRMEKDPVCGMMVDPKRAAGSSVFGGKTYVFCSAGCKASFDRNPAKYAK